MTKKISELSIFFPFWNEEKNVKNVVESAISVAKELSEKWEILIVDDGSSDKTASIGKKLEEENKNIRLISHKPNRGYGAALKSGFTNAKYKYVVFTDGDGQFDISELDRFVDAIVDADIVIGYRKRRRDSFARHILMNMLKVWDFIFFGFYYRDIDCGFKMFQAKAQK